ncbi:hypothetical protein Tco_0728371 [Tanacetum coccineum]|uniref:Transposase (Putative), gypsy type n=1 Tax=Tanacetum coccineum TaxID=301880 RepID=A0ABQ4YNC7_9ASTR
MKSKLAKEWRVSGEDGGVVATEWRKPRKLLALPWGWTPRLDSGTKVKNHVVRMAGVGPLSGKGPVLSWLLTWDYLPWTLVDPWIACKSDLLGFNFFFPIMSSIDDINSILTQSVLDAWYERFHIPPTVHPELPSRNSMIRNSPTSKIGVYTRFFDLSQLSVIVAAKVSHFEILCRVHGFVPTVGNFRRFDINSKNKGWMTFSKHSENAPVCYTRPLDSLKHWNGHFFWVDAYVFPLVVPWHNNKTLRKDPHPTPDEFDANVCDYLTDNPAPFKKLLEPFLCFLGMSRYYDLDENYYPTLWADDEEEMDLFSFIDHEDPTKGNANVESAGNDNVNEEGGDTVVADQTKQSDHVVQIGGIDIVVDDEAQVIVVDKPKKVRKKRMNADGASGSGLPPKKLRGYHGASGDVGASTARKSLAALQGLLDSSTLAMEVAVTEAVTLPFVTSSVTPIPEREDDSSHHSSTNAADDEVTSIARSSMPPPPVLTAVVATTVIADATSALAPKADTEPVPHSIFRDSTSTGEANQDVAGPSHPAGTELSTDSFFVSQDVDSKTLQQIYIPKRNVTNDSALDEPDLCHGVIDHLAPPSLFCQLRSMDYEQLFVEFNVGAARQTCLSFKVRLRLEHELKGRKKLEDKCAMQAGWLKERDVDIANLKAQLSLKEAEAAEAMRLSGQIATVEAAEAARASELEGLKERNVTLEGQLEGTCSELRNKVSGYKLFKEQIEAVQDVQVKVLSDRVAELEANLMGMALHLYEEFYPYFLTTIAGQRWILSRGLRLVVMKCLQSLEYLAALGGAIGRAIDKGMQGGLAADIDHGNARRGLTDVAAYDPSAEPNYLSAVSALRALNFPILAQLESYKDTSIANIMGLLHLEAPAAETLERLKGNAVSRQLSIYDALVPPIEQISAENLVGEASTSKVLVTVTTTALSTTFIQVSTVPLVSAVDHDASGARPSTEVPSPSKIAFEKEELETTPEHTMAS